MYLLSGLASVFSKQNFRLSYVSGTFMNGSGTGVFDIEYISFYIGNFKRPLADSPCLLLESWR